MFKAVYFHSVGCCLTQTRTAEWQRAPEDLSPPSGIIITCA